MGDPSRASGRQAQHQQLLADELVPMIAVHLDETGEYRAVLDPSAAQQLVDLRWAALRAGRLLGRRAKVTTTQVVASGRAPVVAWVRFASSHVATIPRQRQPGQQVRPGM